MKRPARGERRWSQAHRAIATHSSEVFPGSEAESATHSATELRVAGGVRASWRTGWWGDRAVRGTGWVKERRRESARHSATRCVVAGRQEGRGTDGGEAEAEFRRGGRGSCNRSGAAR